MKDINKVLEGEFKSGVRFFDRWRWALTAHLKKNKGDENERYRKHIR